MTFVESTYWIGCEVATKNTVRGPRIPRNGNWRNCGAEYIWTELEFPCSAQAYLDTDHPQRWGNLTVGCHPECIGKSGKAQQGSNAKEVCVLVRNMGSSPCTGGDRVLTTPLDAGLHASPRYRGPGPMTEGTQDLDRKPIGAVPPPDTLITLSVGSVNTAYTRCDRYDIDPRVTGSDVSTYMPAEVCKACCGNRSRCHSHKH